MKPIQQWLVILIFATLVSCATKAKSKQQGIEWASIEHTEKALLSPDRPDTLPYLDLYVDFNYPTSTEGGDEELEKLQRLFIELVLGEGLPANPQKAVDAYVANLINEYKRENQEQYLNDLNDLELQNDQEAYTAYLYSLNHFSHLGDTIEYVTPAFVSFAVKYQVYLGGAHGNTIVWNHTVDLNRMEKITEDDLFTQGYKSQLKPLIQSYLLKFVKETRHADEEVSDEFLQQYFFDFDKIEHNSNLLLDKKGVRYTFNSYEIAPYASGMFEIVIPYDQLEDILKPEAKRELFQ